jgi:hypothetical protein
MDSTKEMEFETRLARVEQSIAALQRSLDALFAESSPAVGRTGSNLRGGRRDRLAEQMLDARGPGSAAPGRRANFAEDFAASLPRWFSSKTPEWWLSRLGIGFVVLAVVLLYGYAIDRGWITPPIRVLAGLALGGGLFWAATRIDSSAKAKDPRDLGFRELLFGGALAVWYVTAYAAAVWYQVISIPSARLAFFVLAMLSTWIALQERREIFAFVAVATGFATPFILTAPATSMTELSLYLGAMTAMGLTIYLMRGWPSIVWITFVGFWISFVGVTNTGGRVSPAQGSIALSVLIILGTAAFVRVPALRRELLLLGSDRYTPFPLSSAMNRLMDSLDSLAAALGGGKSASDSLALWVLPLWSPILAADFLQSMWPAVPKEIWGVGLILLAAGAFVFARRGPQPGTEVRHVAMTGAVAWTVLALGRIASTPEGIPLAAFVATLVLLSYVSSYAGPRAVAKAAIAFALFLILGHELSFADVGLVHLRWLLSGIATVGCAGLIAQTLIEDPGDKRQGMVLAIAAYLTGLVIMWRALEPVWPPLVTTSYAVLGAVILVLSRRPGSNPLLRHLGAATMLIVVARLFVVDLSSVETVWRVLLFLVVGALFLYTGYRMQPRPAAKAGK